MTLSPSQSQIQEALRSFLLSILPSGIDVFEGQDNRVPEPEATDFVVMTTITRTRLSTNLDTAADVQFIASITGATMTVTEVAFGTIAVGATVNGADVAANTTITALGSGSGGDGTYTINPSQTVASTTMASGTLQLMQPTEIVVQLDFHSANVQDSADMVQTVATAFRDSYAVDQFASSGFDVAPLYAETPRQVPFINAEQQYETRWALDLHLQANQVISVPQQYADELDLSLVNVEAAYPAS